MHILGRLFVCFQEEHGFFILASPQLLLCDVFSKNFTTCISVTSREQKYPWLTGHNSG